MKERVLRDKAFVETKIDKRALSKFVKRNKATKWIAQYFKVSQRTIYRRIEQYGLKGVRPKGRKPFPKKIRKIRKLKGWVLTRKYIDNLDRQYRFLNIQYPPTKYVNTITLACSDRKAKPKGKFTSCSVYYVALESQMHFLYAIQYRYSEEGVTYDEIHHYFSNHAMDMLRLSLQETDLEIIDLAAFHFTFKTEEIKPVIAYTKKAFAEKKIGKRELAKFVKRNKATKWIAQYFKVSQKTIYRRIRQFGLKGVRPKGRKGLHG